MRGFLQLRWGSSSPGQNGGGEGGGNTKIAERGGDMSGWEVLYSGEGDLLKDFMGNFSKL